MPFVKGKSGNPSGANGRSKIATHQIISALNEPYDGQITKLRRLVDVLVNAGCEGDIQAVLAVFDRTDGKPAQESTVTIAKRDATDWTRDELIARLEQSVGENDSDGIAAPNGRGGETDKLH